MPGIDCIQIQLTKKLFPSIFSRSVIEYRFDILVHLKWWRCPYSVFTYVMHVIILVCYDTTMTRLCQKYAFMGV